MARASPRKGYMQDNLTNHLHMQQDDALTLKIAMSLFLKKYKSIKDAFHCIQKNILVSRFPHLAVNALQ